MIHLFASSASRASQPPLALQHHGHVPLDQVVRPMLTTAEAAFYLNRQP